MYILGLTGSIAMGKSETARMFRRLRVPVIDSDAIVHQLFAKGGALVPKVDALFPGVAVNGAIDRNRLGIVVLSDNQRMKQLEALVHPAVQKVQAQKIRQAARAGHDLVVVDIPLLFETKGEKRMDGVMVVSAPAFVQKARALKRPNMNKLKLAAILQRQVPDRIKRQRADFVVHSGLGRHWALNQVKSVIAKIRAVKWKVGKFRPGLGLQRANIAKD